MPCALQHLASAASPRLLVRLPLLHRPFLSSTAAGAVCASQPSSPSAGAAMDVHHLPPLLVLSGKSPKEADTAQTLKNKTDGLHLLVEGREQELQILLHSETDYITNTSFRPQLYMDALSTSCFGRLLIWSPRLSSTHDLVSQNFAELPCGTVCVTDVQFKGRGRAKNVWESPPGCLLFSFTSEMEDGHKVPQFQYVVSLAVTEAIKELCRAKGLQQLDVKIKWPNDLYLNGLKVGGILCTSTYQSKKFNICAGIGLNLDNEKPTTCLNALLRELEPDSQLLKREVILASFFNKFESLYAVFLSQGFQVFQELYYETWLHSGQKVIIEEKKEDGSLEETVVTIQGLTPSGYLLAIGEDTKNYELHPDGNRISILTTLAAAGGVTLAGGARGSRWRHVRRRMMPMVMVDDSSGREGG